MTALLERAEKPVEKSVMHDNMPPGLLRIDPRYQRKPNKSWLRDRKGKLDWQLFGRLIVSARNDGFYVVDGQHRLELALSEGVDGVPVELHAGLTLSQEARLFHDLDTQRRGLSTDDNFRALVVAEDPVALSVKEVLDRHSIRHGHFREGNGFRAFKTAIFLVNKYGLAAFEDALSILHETWPDNRRATSGQLLLGMAEFRMTFPKIDRVELIDKLRGHTSPEKLWAHAQALSGSLSSNTVGSVATAILTVWNWKRQSQRLKGKWLTT